MRKVIWLFLLLTIGWVSTQAEEIPSGVPQQASAAMEKAKNWRADAVLVMVEVNDWNRSGKFEIRFSLYSPSDGTGLWITPGGPGGYMVAQAGPVNWGTQPIPKDFLDLPAAVEQARKGGMSGQMDHAMLQFWEGKGLAWRIAPAYDPNLRVYDVAALSGGGEIHPKDADVYYNRGLDYYNKGQYDQAISNFTKAIEINPRDADAYINRGNAYDDKGLHDQAISDYTKAIELNPKDADAYIDRGNVYDDKDLHDQAISDYNKAIEIKPGFAYGYYNRAVAYYNKGEYSRAWDDVHKAQSLGYQVNPGFLDKLRKASTTKQQTGTSEGISKETSSDQQADKIYTALLKDPSNLPDLTKPFSSPHGEAVSLTQAERATGMVGKIVVKVEWSVLAQPGGQNAIGYRVYESYAAARRAFDSLSVVELGIATPVNHFSPLLSEEDMRYFKSGKCEAFEEPKFPDTISVRCATLDPEAPVIVTGLIREKKSHVLLDENPLGSDPVDTSMLHAAAFVPQLIDAGMSRVNAVKKELSAKDNPNSNTNESEDFFKKAMDKAIEEMNKPK